jgi:membrane associated rhomboid family serine protease
MFPPLTPVVKQLLIINVLVYFGAQLILGDGSQILAMAPLASDNFRPFQIISHMFMHSGITHLLFNMLMLFFLGPMVEQALGAKKFLILYILSGFGALLAHFAIFPYVGVVGASGAVYGVLIAFAVLYPNVRMMLLFPPIPIKAKWLAIGLIVIGLVSGIGGYQSGIAHFAHLGGALTAFILMVIWKKFQFGRK